MEKYNVDILSGFTLQYSHKSYKIGVRYRNDSVLSIYIFKQGMIYILL